MKAEFWQKNLSMEKATETYAKLIGTYTGFEMPGEYWMLHHILPDAIMYVARCLIAAILAAELLIIHRTTLEKKMVDIEVEAGKYIREIVELEAAIDLSSTISRLDSSLFMNRVTTIE
jgi:hypothetical protein